MTTATIDERVLRPRLDHKTAMRLAAAEYQRFGDLLRPLSPDDWAKPSPCPPWDIRDLAAPVRAGVLTTPARASVRVVTADDRRAVVGDEQASRDGVVDHFDTRAVVRDRDAAVDVVAAVAG